MEGKPRTMICSVWEGGLDDSARGKRERDEHAEDNMRWRRERGGTQRTTTDDGPLMINAATAISLLDCSSARVSSCVESSYRSDCATRRKEHLKSAPMPR